MSYRFLKSTFLLLLMLFVLSASLFAQRPAPKKTFVKGDTLYTLLNPGDIPPIMEPVYVSVTEAEKTYYDNEPLLVVADGDEAKAYSIWHLDHHEVVNDYINGKAITITW